MAKVENKDENQIMTKSQITFIVISTILFANPIIPYIFALFCFMIGATFLFYKKPYHFFYIAIYFFSFAVLARWSSQNLSISALFRSTLIFMSIFFILTNYITNNNKIIIQKDEVIIDIFCIFWIFLTAILLLMDPNSLYTKLMGFREYAVFFIFFIFFNHAIRKGIDKLTCLKMLFYGIGIIAFFNILFNFKLLIFPSFENTDTDTLIGSIRTIAGIPVLRMHSLIGGSPGGTALTYTVALFGFIFLPFSKIKYIFIPVLCLAIFFLASFSSFFVIMSFLLVYFLFNYGNKLKVIMIPVTLTIMVLLIILSKFITLDVNINERLSAYDYASNMISMKGRVLTNFGPEFLTGSGFDIKTSANLDQDRKISRDNGVLNAFVSHGIIGLLLVALFYIYGFYCMLKIITTSSMIKENKNIYMVVSIAFLSSLFFLHGLALTTRPIDVLSVVSAGILFNYKKDIL
jgi:hypothetical protein